MHDIQWFVFTCVLLSGQFGLIFARDVYELPTCRDTGICYTYQWQSDIRTEVDKEHNKLKVQFSHAPPKTNFEKYKVALKGDNYNVVSIETDMNEVVFSNICNGNYNVSVKPLDLYSSVNGKCQCYMIGGDCRKCRPTQHKMTITDVDDSKCNKTTNGEASTTVQKNEQDSKIVQKSSPPVISSSVSSPPISTTPVNYSPINNPTLEKSSTTTVGTITKYSTQTQSNHPETTTVTSSQSSILQSSTTIPNANDKDKIVLWVVVGFGSVIILLCAIFYMCSKRENLTDKKILFLYSHDHQHHLDVGKAMAAYLQHFKCNVLYPPLFAEEEIKQWLHKTVADCDFVLLLHSECIKRQSEPWANGLEYPQLRDNRNENVLMSILTMIRECPLLQLYHSKYISCRLEHLSELYVLSEFPSVQNFVLTRDLNKLICYIHHIPPNSVLKSLTLRSSYSSASSMALQQAAQKAAEFEKNKMWFTQKYSYLVPRCGVLNDKCDCRSALNEEFDGTVDISEVPLNTFHDVNFDDSVSKQYNYFNDIHSFSEMSLVSSELALLNDRNDQQYKNRYSLLPSLSEGITDCVSNWTDVTYASSRGSNPVCV